MTHSNSAVVSSGRRRLRNGAALLAVAAAIVLVTYSADTQVDTVRFAVIGDFGLASPTLENVANMIKSWNPDFIITTGDNNYELGEASTIDANIGQYFHEFISPYYGTYGPGGATNRFFPSLGNHDWGDGFVNPPSITPYTDYFTLPGNERYYDFVRGPVHFFAIDSDFHEPDGITPNSVQGQWLQNALANSTALWKIVYFHHPWYTSATRGGLADMNWPFREWGASAVLAGHHHDYERLIIQNTPYFVNGLGGNGRDLFTFPLPGSMVRSSLEYGAQLVTASSSGISFEFITRRGMPIDSYFIEGPAGADAPHQLVATGVPTGRIDLWWTDRSTGELGFGIERSDDGVTFNQIAVTAPNETAFVDTSVSVETTPYRYRVRALMAAGETAYSNIADTATVPNSPAAPVLTATAPTSSTIRLTWPDVATEAGYRIYRLSNSVFTFIASVHTDVTTFDDTGRAPNTNYRYVVRGFNAGGESLSSNEANATTLAPLSAPTGVTATAVSSSQINLAWTDTSGLENGFRIERSANGIAFFTLGWSGANVTTFVHTGRLPNTTEYYRVRAYENGGGESAPSNVASATTMSLPPAPSGLTATSVSTSRIDLNWTDNSTTEAQFRIYRSTDGTTFSFASQVNANITTAAMTGLQPETTYYFQVLAHEAGGGDSDYSNTASATTAALPSAPSSLTATAVSSGQINLTWTDNATTEDGFRIDRSSDGTSFATLAWVGPNVTSYNNTGRPPSTTYYYRLVAYNSLGYSAPSNTASATTFPPIAAPSGLTATPVSGTRIDLAWTDNTTNETGFRVHRSTDGTTFTFLANVGANATTYASTSLTPTTTYYYRVTTVEVGGAESAPSNVASATTFGVPAAPSGLTATAISSTAITLTWTDNASSEDGFRIDRSTNGVNFGTAAWVGPNVTTFTNTGRTPGTTYYYRVVAYNANGNSTSSNVASATTAP